MDKKIKRQIPLQLSGLHVREQEGEQRSRTIEGHAVVFGVRSVNLTPWSSWREVYEIMEPGSITTELLQRSDVMLTAFHNNEIILGRSNKGQGTLSLSIDGKGLLVRCELPDTERANELLTAIERGDVSGMSFAFTTDEEDSQNCLSWEHVREEDHDGLEVWIRHVKLVKELYDVTIAGHPAYPQTDIAQREIDAELDKILGEPEGLKAKREADEKREAEEKKAKEEAEAKALAEQEQHERELVSVATARRNRARLMCSDIEDIIY